MQLYWEFCCSKNDNFQMIKCDVFHMFASKIYQWYLLELPLCFGQDNTMGTLLHPGFTIKKWGSRRFKLGGRGNRMARTLFCSVLKHVLKEDIYNHSLLVVF